MLGMILYFVLIISGKPIQGYFNLKYDCSDFVFSIAVEKFRSMDDAFRKQLDAKELSQRKAMDAMITEKEGEVIRANQRVRYICRLDLLNFRK